MGVWFAHHRLRMDAEAIHTSTAHSKLGCSIPSAAEVAPEPSTASAASSVDGAPPLPASAAVSRPASVLSKPVSKSSRLPTCGCETGRPGPYRVGQGESARLTRRGHGRGSDAMAASIRCEARGVKQARGARILAKGRRASGRCEGVGCEGLVEPAAGWRQGASRKWGGNECSPWARSRRQRFLSQRRVGCHRRGRAR